MRIKEGFVLREVAGQTMVVATGEASKDFHGIIKLNSTGKEIWQGLTEGLSKEEIIKKMAEKYEVDVKKLTLDVDEMIKQMTEAGFLVK